jgi:hypothetical protein
MSIFLGLSEIQDTDTLTVIFLPKITVSISCDILHQLLPRHKIGTSFGLCLKAGR